MFKFYMPVEIHFEPGISKQAAQFIKGNYILMITDPFLYKEGIAQEIGDSIQGKNVEYFSDIEPNPSGESVDKATKLAREMNADCIIGLGGGSAMDVSKIVACLTTNEGSIYDYYSGGSKQLGDRNTTLICIPTTAGTGSEVTNVGVFTNAKTGVKAPFVSGKFWPDYALVDSELTITLPPSITASTGMDAFIHSIEAYWNKESQPMSDVIAMYAMKLIIDNIETAYKEPDNMESRTQMMKASVLAGVAFSQTRTTGIHAVSFSLTADYSASHGVACAITLPAFIRLSKEKNADKVGSLANLLGFENIDKFADEIESLLKRIGMPTRLTELGVKRDNLKDLTKAGLSQGIIQLTPATMNEDTVYKLLESIL